VIKKVVSPAVWETSTKEPTKMTKDGAMAKALKWYIIRMEANGITHTRNISKEVVETES
jgi:hypothetical protein